MDNDFVGGHAALDFLNTVIGSGKSRDNSAIGTWADFLQWAEAASIFGKGELKRLRALPAERAEQSLKAVHELREMAFAALHRFAAGDTQTTPQWQTLSKQIRDSLQRAELCYREGRMDWRADLNTPQGATDFFALLLHDLLLRQDLQRLKECQCCSWLFLNSGRGRGRKWCDMKRCGNRMKVQTFRSRHADR